MRTATYIRRLLEERKPVVLPGFGTLVLRETEAQQAPSGSRIEPPGKQVYFDAQHTKDDGALASAFAQAENLDPGEAVQQVLELVDAIKFALDKGENYLLPDTGTFSRDDDGKVHFTVSPDWILDPDQYGLGSVDILELEELPEEEAEPGLEEKQTPAAPDKKQDDVTPRPSPVEFMQPPKAEEKKRKWGFIWWIAAALVLVLIGILIIPDQIIKKEKAEPGSAIESTMDQEPSPGQDDPAERERGQQEAQSAEALEDETPDDGQEETSAVEQEARYFIIAGSFQKLSYASELQDRLKAQGYPAEVMITENRMYRVSVASFVSRQEAEDQLRELKTKDGLEAVWLLFN